MPSPRPPRRVFPLIHQNWRNVGFLHWPFEPSLIQPLLPPPLELDLYDEEAWVTLTPFTTTCELFSILPLPGPRRFCEVNVRTYVRAPDGTDGLLFLSLDVTNRSNVVCGRALGLPYHAATSHHDHSLLHRYRGQRVGDGMTIGYDVTLRPQTVAAQASLDVFLTGRWSAFVPVGPRLVRFDVHHEAWPLVHADVITVEENLLRAAGVPHPNATPIAHFAPQVDARLAPAPLSHRCSI
jgi:uncharacterized protein